MFRKKPSKKEKTREQEDLQSFFHIGSIPELIIFSVIAILFFSYISVFGADGFVFTRILKKEQGKETVPDKRQIVGKLDAEKIRLGRYPDDIAAIGVKTRYGSTRIVYDSNGEEFSLCYSYFPYIENTASCYYSKEGKWK